MKLKMEYGLCIKYLYKIGKQLVTKLIPIGVLSTPSVDRGVDKTVGRSSGGELPSLRARMYPTSRPTNGGVGSKT